MPIIIKRYPNRKLYNTQTKRYITLEQIEDLIKNKQEIKVLDNDSGNDLTAVTLSQVIYEIEKKQSGFLPIKILMSLVQAGGNRLDEIRTSIFNSLNLSHHYDVEIERRINLLVDLGELSSESGAQLLDKLLVLGKQNDISKYIDGKIYTYIKEQQLPNKNDLQPLIKKIEEMSQMLDEYNTVNKKGID